MEWLNIVAGPVLGIVSAVITVQIWAIRTAKKAGAREERERVMQEELDAAHKKIREVVMPKVEVLEGQVKELSIRAEGTADTMAEMKSDVKAVLATVQQLAVTLAALGASNGNGH